ncbi:NAD(P)H-quinone oxidoreductase [Inquilinus sp. CAU 1745]|uniref:NAD(P)H-quinone oxidoreductase n=1 Tax=Inquilinus sp. CAU 1745 TaxID=3140369 RepID=UPI00325B1D64
MASPLPSTMTAIEIAEYGGPEALRPTEAPVPEPGENEVLIEVEAAGINRPDVLQRKGLYPPPPGASPLPGLEVAGRIVRLGMGVRHLKEGQEVCALVSGGGYAPYCVAPAPQTLPVPKGLSMVEAAAVPETYFTVWANVFDRGRLKEGESFLVHGGTSGIGTTAIQLAKTFGATVFATAGGPAKCRACEELGADRAIDYKAEDFVQAVKAATGDRGVDLILDMVGGDYLPRNIEALATEGRHVSIAFMRGPKAEINIQKIMAKRLTLTGTTLRARTVAQKGAIAQTLQQKVWPLLESRKVRPLIHQTFPLEQAADAQALMESSTHVGKIVLTMPR